MNSQFVRKNVRIARCSLKIARNKAYNCEIQTNSSEGEKKSELRVIKLLLLFFSSLWRKRASIKSWFFTLHRFTQIPETVYRAKNKVQSGNQLASHLFGYRPPDLAIKVCKVYILPSACSSLNVFQVFEFLIRLHSLEAIQEEEVYPYIRTLLHFDTREFLNVLALVRTKQRLH